MRKKDVAWLRRYLRSLFTSGSLEDIREIRGVLLDEIRGAKRELDSVRELFHTAEKELARARRAHAIACRIKIKKGM